ncbi:MAG: glycosyltransferase family 9 protein [Lentisphaerae bacterium]|nr:glycosyltransferase family 9 protein [Lentisphaerota bacterium]
MTVREQARAVPRILILRGGALGDFILTLPAIRALRRQWPSASIELIAHPNIAELAAIAGLINHVRPLSAAGMAEWFVPNRVWPERERNDIASFDLIISYLSDSDGVVQANLRRAGAKLVLTCCPVVSSGHAADHFLSPLKDLDVSPQSQAAPLLPWPEAQREQARQWLKRQGAGDNVISLHPGSGSSKKNWPIEKFIGLANQVQCSLSAQPLFILGEADTETAKTLAAQAPAIPVLINRPLPEVGSVLAESRGYVGNDSGITHLAAALGIPVVALFGPTEAAVWGPCGANVVIIQGHEPTAEALAAIEPAAVLRALRHSMAK